MEIQKLFLPYQLAEIAYEKGFDGKVIATYNKDKTFNLFDYEIRSSMQLIAPMYQQVVDWFRAKHNLHIEVMTRGEDDEYPKWQYWIVNTKKSNRIELAMDELNADTLIEFNSYYEALNKAIEEAFKLI